MLAALLLVSAWSARPPASAQDLPLAQVSGGMTGYGITAGPANALVRFPVTVLSIQAVAGPGFPLVLVRASGDFIARSGGVSAGMSGSSVHLATANGPRLLGAIGYVFPSTDHHLALVTPIGAMRDVTGSPASGGAHGRA